MEESFPRGGVERVQKQVQETKEKDTKNFANVPTPRISSLEKTTLHILKSRESQAIPMVN